MASLNTPADPLKEGTGFGAYGTSKAYAHYANSKLGKPWYQPNTWIADGKTKFLFIFVNGDMMYMKANTSAHLTNTSRFGQFDTSSVNAGTSFPTTSAREEQGLLDTIPVSYSLLGGGYTTRSFAAEACPCALSLNISYSTSARAMPPKVMPSVERYADYVQDQQRAANVNGSSMHTETDYDDQLNSFGTVNDAA
jgi:hypothetical protein